MARDSCRGVRVSVKIAEKFVLVSGERDVRTSRLYER